MCTGELIFLGRRVPAFGFFRGFLKASTKVESKVRSLEPTGLAGDGATGCAGWLVCLAFSLIDCVRLHQSGAQYARRQSKQADAQHAITAASIRPMPVNGTVSPYATEVSVATLHHIV